MNIDKIAPRQLKWYINCPADRFKNFERRLHDTCVYNPYGDFYFVKVINRFNRAIWATRWNWLSNSIVSPHGRSSSEDSIRGGIYREIHGRYPLLSGNLYDER